MFAQLDSLDHRILSLLDQNARFSCSELARLVKRGRDTVEYRVQRLIDGGIVRGFYAAIDFMQLGFTLYKCYLRFSVDEFHRRQLLDGAMKHPRVLWLAEASGEWDLVIAIAAKSVQEFTEVENQLLGKISSRISYSEVFVISQFLAYSIRFKSMFPLRSFHFSNSDPIHLDKLDQEILLRLAMNARVPVTTLAADLGVSVGLIRRHIERLESRKVILGYHVDLNLELLGLTLYKTQIYLDAYREKLAQELRAWCEKQTETFSFVQQIGSCRVEIESRIDGYQNYVAFINKLRATFNQSIRETKTLTLHSIHLNWGIFREIGIRSGIQ